MPGYRRLDGRIYRCAAGERRAKVHAVDVGHGQLAWKLRCDDRVVVHEKTNARYLDRADGARSDRGAGVRCELHRAGDVAAGATGAYVLPGAWAIVLIKPQFEAGAAAVGGKGVVRDPAVHRAVCERLTHWWSGLPGWTVAGVVESPITGPEGNKEFLLGATLDLLRTGPRPSED